MTKSFLGFGQKKAENANFFDIFRSDYVKSQALGLDFVRRRGAFIRNTWALRAGR